MSDSGSTVPRRQVGRLMRQLREQAGITLMAAAEELEFSRARMYRIENGEVPVRKHDVIAMCGVYQASPQMTEVLIGLAQESKAKGWWHAYGDVVPGWFELSFLRKPANYYLVLVVAVLCYVLIRRLVASRAGRAMIALRENEPLATSVGVDVTKFLVLATMISAAMAGAAGALYAHYVRIVDPDVFLFIYTVTMVIMVISGGKGTLAGPIVGGLIFGLLPEVLRAAAIKPEAQWVVYGVLMILVVYFLPEGIVPALRRWWQSRAEPAGTGRPMAEVAR